jgi:hypothetical protein
MKYPLLASLVVLLLPACTPAGESGHGIAVVELFTSQGCSSCPPADAVFAELHDGSMKQGKAVYCLSFHVDYWNRLGWTDPYSQAAFSARQRDYAYAKSSLQVYTPQMIVNGQDGFVGSDRQQARSAIDAALRSPAQSTIELTAGAGSAPGEIQVSYRVDGPERQILHLALVQKEAMNHVPVGENAGKDLRHRQVVRDFRSVASATGEMTLRIPEGLAWDGFEVIGYTQKGQTGVITGATRVSLGAAPLPPGRPAL